MIIPRKIIFLTTLLLPLALAATILPSLLALLYIAATSIVLAAAVDFVLCGIQGGKVKLSVAEVIRGSQHRPGSCWMNFENISESNKNIVNLYTELPDQIGFEPEVNCFTVNANSVASLNAQFAPQRRGTFRFGTCYFEVISPFKLWGYRARVEPDAEFRIYPDVFSEQRKMASLFLNRGQSGEHILRLTGQGREFDCLREYVPGDSYDIVAWKATARRRKPISKVFKAENTQNIYAIIDSSRFSLIEKDGRSNLDHYLASSLNLGNLAVRQKDAFGIITFDSKVRNFVPAMVGESSVRMCRDTVYGVKALNVSPDYNRLFTFIRSRIPRRSLLFFLTDISNDLAAEDFMRDIQLITRKHLCMVNMLTHEEIRPIFSQEISEPNELYVHLAGQLKWGELQSHARRLSHYGVGFDSSSRDSLSLDLVNTYLNIKRKQLL